MKPNVYKIVELCVNSGTTFGVNRAFKHKDTLTREDIVHITEHVHREIMNEFCEYFDFYEPFVKFNSDE